MTQHLVFLLLGLGGGAVFAALALGLVMTYRSSGVVNFATGAMALYAAYTYSFLRQGRLLLPFPGLPESVGLGAHLGFVPALIIALALTAGLGALLHLLVFRRLATSPAVAKAVASIGVMVTLQAMFAVRLGTNPVRVDRILPRSQFTIGDIRVPGDRLWFAGVIVVVAVTLALVMHHTRFGLATRAVAESEKGALVTGLAADRIALANWALSAAVAGLGGILIAPIVPLVPFSYTLFIVPALAAALAAGFQRLPVAVAAGLAIGVVQSELSYLQTQHAWLPQQGMREAVPLVLILGFLVFNGRPLPPRGALVVQSLGRAPRPRRVLTPAVFGVVGGLGALLLTGGSYRSAVITSMILAVIALSFVVVTGYAGQVSLAQLALAGVGAFLLSRLTVGAGVPFPIAPLLAATGATVVGVVIGLPALRIRGLPVAVVTLALAVGVEALWFRNPSFTGGVQGANVRPPTLLGLDVGIGAGADYPRVGFGVVCLVLLVAVAVAVALLRRSRAGAAMVAVRANERAAAAAGIDVARTKVLAFAIGSFIAGLGGSLLAYQQTLATPDTYAALAGLGLFAVVYITGVTSVSGGLLAGVAANGGIVYLLLSRAMPSFGGWYEVLTGCLLLVQILRFPEGAAVAVQDRLARFRSRSSGEGEVPPRLVPAGERLAPAHRPTRPVGDVVLQLRNMSVRYGVSVAVDDVSFDVRRGSIVGLIGPNGAGKTTLIDAASGFARCSGQVLLGGRRIDGLPPHERVRAGLGRTFQSIELWDDLSVEENIAVGLLAARGKDVRREQTQSLESLCALVGLGGLRSTPVRSLSQGHRQLVSMARALAGDPEVLLLDEPAGGLDSTESRWLAERLDDVRETGVAIVLVDHDMNLVLAACDEIHVLDLGALIASGTPEAIVDDRLVAEAYLGATHAGEGAG